MAFGGVPKHMATCSSSSSCEHPQYVTCHCILNSILFYPLVPTTSIMSAAKIQKVLARQQAKYAPAKFTAKHH